MSTVNLQGPDYFRITARSILRNRLTRPCDIDTHILDEEDFRRLTNPSQLPGRLVGFFTRSGLDRPCFVLLEVDSAQAIVDKQTFIYLNGGIQIYQAERQPLRRLVKKNTSEGYINILTKARPAFHWSILIHMVEYILGPKKIYYHYNQYVMRAIERGTTGIAIPSDYPRLSCNLSCPPYDGEEVWAAADSLGFKLLDRDINTRPKKLDASTKFNVIRLRVLEHYLYGIFFSLSRIMTVFLPHKCQLPNQQAQDAVVKYFRALLPAHAITQFVYARFADEIQHPCNSAIIARASIYLAMFPSYYVKPCDVQSFLPPSLIRTFLNAHHGTYEAGEASPIDAEEELEDIQYININPEKPLGEPVELSSNITIVTPERNLSQGIRDSPSIAQRLFSPVRAGQAAINRLTNRRVSDTSSSVDFAHVWSSSQSSGTSRHTPIDEDEPVYQNYSNSPRQDVYENLSTQSSMPEIVGERGPLSQRSGDNYVEDHASPCHSAASSQATVVYSQSNVAEMSQLQYFEEAIWQELVAHESRPELTDSLGNPIPPVAKLEPKTDRDGILHDLNCFRQNIIEVSKLGAPYGGMIITLPIDETDLSTGKRYVDKRVFRFVVVPVIMDRELSLIIIDRCDTETGLYTWGYMDPEIDLARRSINYNNVEKYMADIRRNETDVGFSIQLQTQFHEEYPKMHLILGVYTLIRYFKYAPHLPSRVIYNERDLREYCYRICQNLAIENHKYNLANHLIRDNGYLKSSAYTSLPSPIIFESCPVKSDQCPFCLTRGYRSLSQHIMMTHGGLARRARAQRRE